MQIVRKSKSQERRESRAKCWQGEQRAKEEGGRSFYSTGWVLGVQGCQDW